jgi:DNA-binding response OmpR family regulator
LGNVLILAREEVVAALLGLMVEVSGFEPTFTGTDQSTEDAVKGSRLHAVLVDCDHPDFTGELIGVIKNSGARPILFSPFRVGSAVTRLAALYETRSFTLPTEPVTFGRILRS